MCVTEMSNLAWLPWDNESVEAEDERSEKSSMRCPAGNKAGDTKVQPGRVDPGLRSPKRK